MHLQTVVLRACWMLSMTIMHCYLYTTIWLKMGKKPTRQGYWNIILAFILVGLIILISEQTHCDIIFTYTYYLMGTYTGFYNYCYQFLLAYNVIEYIVKLPKKSWIFCIILPLSIAIYGFLNAKTLIIDHVDLENNHYNGTIKIAQVSDIHLGPLNTRKFTETVVDKIIETDPDIVVITGDIVDGILQLEKDWVEPFDRINVPVLYITGNHEMKHGKQRVLDILEMTKIQNIGDSIYEFKGINFIGIDFESKFYKKMDEFYPKYIDNGNINIVLNHIPSVKPKVLEKYDVFLMLTGHTHGGQVWPFGIPAYFGNACYQGLYKNSESENYVYVSDGVGVALVPMRQGSKSMISLITINGKKNIDL